MLDKLENCLQAIDKDSDIQTSISTSVKLVKSTVNYIIGKNDDIMTSPYDAMDKTLDELGLPATTIPVIQHADDGSSALSVQRVHYLLDVSVYFRDLVRVIEYLNRFGLLGNRNDLHQNSYPDAPEYAAIVIDSLIVQFAKDISYFDDAVTRRTYYSRLGDEKETSLLFEKPSREEILTKINTAKKGSEEIKAEFSALSQKVFGA